LETKQPLSVGTSVTQAVGASAEPSTLSLTTDAASNTSQLADNQDGLSVQGAGAVLAPGVARVNLDRVTNPKGNNAQFNPPFGHVLVQTRLPTPGQVYNILFLSVYNGTGQTFTASDNITVRAPYTPAGEAFPILQGNQEWKPGGRIVFYVLTKQYYPFTPTQTAGFQFNFINRRVSAVPGPSGIALRVKYNPATFDQTLDRAVTSGPGAIGHQFGLPDTAIWALFTPSAKIIPL
jgi:hypothetical protein